MEHKVLYKSVKKPIGVEITLHDLLEGNDGMEYCTDGDGKESYTFDETNDTIVVTIGGKKVDPKKVKIKLTEDV